MCGKKKSASVDGGLSRGSSVRRPGSEGPYGNIWNHPSKQSAGEGGGAFIWNPNIFVN